MVLNVHRNRTAYQGRGKGGGEGVWRCGEREIIYLSLHCHHQNDFCIKVGSDESHFNVPVASDGQSHKTVSTNYNLIILSHCRLQGSCVYRGRVLLILEQLIVTGKDILSRADGHSYFIVSGWKFSLSPETDLDGHSCLVSSWCDFT